jgi:hypothetical protein
VSRLVTTIDGAHDRRGRFVLAIFDDAIVAVRKQIEVIPVDPLSIVFWILSKLMKGRVTSRADILRDAGFLEPTALAKAYSGSRMWRMDDIREVQLTRHPRKLRLQITPHKGRRKRFIVKDVERAIEVGATLREVLGGRMVDGTHVITR